MAVKELKEPQSMDELIYFTNRTVDGGSIKLWVYKITCEKCGKGLMQKPRDEKTGLPKIRAKEYVCSECANTEEKKAHEEKLIAQAVYTCPSCKKEGSWEGPFKRRTIGGVPTIRVTCEHCAAHIDVTKKMKQKKSKKKNTEDVDADF
ncbi:hypothetical protein D6774_02400 [Candidatus Woesearchaeota archaeon]|jgi:ssDNA-binding Zn-finger/Zn-ribbon topoisomerase 1|nr:MAG: hypothetical protein D6774_02400 [Candidatus Woesearchaeota archaeon]